MAEFPTAVAPPGGASYAAPLLNFAQFGNWKADDPFKKVRDEQLQQINQQRIQEGQRQQELADALKAGGALDAQGNFDPRKAAAIMAKFGDLANASTISQQVPAAMSPMLSGGGQPSPSGGSPASVQAKPLPPPAQNSPQGDSGSGTVAALVTDRLPGQDATTGQTIAKIAQTMGVDPNAALTPGQLRRAQGLLQKYVPAAAQAPAGKPGEGAGAPSFKDRFAGAGGEGGSLPPSANAIAPAPKASPDSGRLPVSQPQPQPPQSQAAPIGAATAQPPGGPQLPQVAPGAPGAPAAPAQPPQQPQGGPLTPQVPLPKGFTDPQQAILALRAEAAKLSSNPRAKGQVEQLTNWAERIENSIKPVEMSSGKMLLDPRTGQPLYQGNQPTLSADAIHSAAERYLETGQLPPNTGRGVQGAATSSAIQNEAATLAAQRGIDMAALPQKWQQFKAQQVAIQRFTSGKQGDTVRSFNVLVDHLDTLKEAAGALKNGDIRLFNRWKQTWATNSGNPAPTNFDGVKALVGDEIVKAVVGGAGALADREEVKKDLDKASSPKQLFELVEHYNKLALGQLKGLRKQYETATGLKNFGDMLLPGTLSALGGNDGKGTAPDKDGWVTLPNGARIQEVK